MRRIFSHKSKHKLKNETKPVQKRGIKFYLPRIAPIVVILIVIAVTFATCSQPQEIYEPPAETPTEPTETSPEITPEEPESTESETEETEEPPYDGPTNPLTGMPVETDITKNRPYAIMLNNLKMAQPQLGISKADIIYEVPVEGGLTRTLAIFQDISDIGVIGSIRSARPYFVDIAQGYDAVYIHAGGSPQAYEVFAARSLTRLDGVNGSKTDIFYRDSQRRQKMGYEHSLVTTSELISQYLPTYNFRLEHNDAYETVLEFADDAAPVDGGFAELFDIFYSSAKKTSFTYIPGENKYALSQHGGAYKDGNTSAQIAVTNVLILKAPVSVISGDTEGRLNIKLIGSGTGYYVNGGKYTEIEWSKNSETAQFTYKLKDGTGLVMGRGVTYIGILPREVEASFN